MAFTSLDQVVAALPGQQRSISKPSITAKGAGYYADLFIGSAGIPGAGAVPASYTAGGTSYNTGGAVAGAIPWANTAGKSTYLAKAMFGGSVVGTLILYDRLWSCSGMSGIVTTAQTISGFSGLPTRASDGANVEAWAEIYTATGSTSRGITISYTNQDGVAGSTSTVTTMVASPGAYHMLPLSLAPGDTGVREVASATLNGSTGTAGSWGITLLRRIAEIPITTVSAGNPLDIFTLGMPLVPDDACLCLAVLASTTSTGVISGNLNLIAG